MEGFSAAVSLGDVHPEVDALDIGARQSGQSAEPERSIPSLGHPRPVAFIAGATAVVALVSYLPAPRALLAAFLAATLVLAAAVDLEHRVIPNRIVFPALGVVLVAQLVLGPEHVPGLLLAGLAGAGVFLVPNLINRSLVGMGDVKLALLLGIGLGWAVLGAISIAFLSTFPFAVAALVRGGLAARRTALPFGPFLTFGALVVLIVPRILGS